MSTGSTPSERIAPNKPCAWRVRRSNTASISTSPSEISAIHRSCFSSRHLCDFGKPVFPFAKNFVPPEKGDGLNRITTEGGQPSGKLLKISSVYRIKPNPGQLWEKSVFG